MTVSLRLHFADEVKMMEWFIKARDNGAFGTMPHPEFGFAESPRLDVGVRHLDSLDKSETKGKQYIVSGTRDPGRWVELLDDEVMPPHTITVNS